MTLRGPLFPGEEPRLRLRILCPPWKGLPEGLREASVRCGAAEGSWGDRPAILGDLRAFRTLCRDGLVPAAFRSELEALLDRSFRLRFRLGLPGGRELVLGDPPAIFGVLNVTPDSFSDGGRFLDPGRALDAALGMIQAGADVIDVGGESSRPGSQGVDAGEERRRVEPVIRRIREAADIPISIDTVKAEVARMALAEGADIINDISALRDDPGMIPLARDAGVPVVIAHRLGMPRDMQRGPRYDDATREVFQFLAERVRRLAADGIGPERIVVDPGIGFGKRVSDNVELLRDLGELRCLGLPVMVGASRKSFIGNLLGGAPVEARQAGTLAVHGAAVLAGAAAVRVHDVGAHKDLIRVLGALAQGPEDPAGAPLSGGRRAP